MHLVQGLTADRSVLREAIASKRMEPPLGFVVRFARAAGSPSQQLVHFVNSIPGRVNLVWITFGAGLPGNPVNDFPDLVSVVHDLNGSSEALHLSRVAVYPIPLDQKWLGHKSPLAQMANAAGGHLYLTGIRQALNEIAATSLDYYTISYVPTNPDWNGAFRKIKVSIEGFPQPPPSESLPSVWSEFLGLTEGQKSKTIYRTGYRARANPSTGEESVRMLQGAVRPGGAGRKLISSSPRGNPARFDGAGADSLQRAMQFGSLPPDGISFTLTTWPSAGLKSGGEDLDGNLLTERFRQDSAHSVRLHYRIDPRSLNFSRDPSGAYRDDLEFVAVVYRDDGTPANSIASTEQVKVSGDEGALAPGITFDQTIALPVSGNPVPGNFVLRVAVDEHSSGRIGAIEIPTEEIKVALPARMASENAAADRAPSNRPPQ